MIKHNSSPPLPFKFSNYSLEGNSLLAKNHWLKLQPHEGDNLDERIVAIPCKRVYGATQTRPCEKSGCSRLRCTVKVSNKTRLLRSHEQLSCPAKKLPFLPLADVDDFGGTSHLSRMDRKTFACHRKSA